MLKLVQDLYKVCDQFEFDVSCFNLALHLDCIEIYTAEEHVLYSYHGSMGVEAYSDTDVLRFVESVKKQCEYYKTKEEK